MRPLEQLRGGEPPPGPSPHVAMPDVSIEALEALVLPWAKRVEPAKYQMTLNVQKTPDTYRKYLLRLAELRWAADVPGRREFPLAVLEASHIEAKLLHRPTGKVLTFRGRQMQPRQWSWLELLLDPQEFSALVEVKGTFDLEIVE